MRVKLLYIIFSIILFSCTENKNSKLNITGGWIAVNGIETININKSRDLETVEFLDLIRWASKVSFLDEKYIKIECEFGTYEGDYKIKKNEFLFVIPHKEGYPTVISDYYYIEFKNENIILSSKGSTQNAILKKMN